MRIEIVARCPAPALVAQAPNPDSAATVDAATRKQVIEGVARRIEEGYIYPEEAREMAPAVLGHAKRGAYDRITGATALAERLTRDRTRDTEHRSRLEEIIADVERGARGF